MRAHVVYLEVIASPPYEWQDCQRLGEPNVKLCGSVAAVRQAPAQAGRVAQQRA